MQKILGFIMIGVVTMFVPFVSDYFFDKLDSPENLFITVNNLSSYLFGLIFIFNGVFLFVKSLYKNPHIK
jgi:uncharacterized membrane protein HdeD (DUF308 family)